MAKGNSIHSLETRDDLTAYHGYKSKAFHVFLLLGYTSASTHVCICLHEYIFTYIYTPHAVSGREHPVPKGAFAVTPGDSPGLQTHASTDLPLICQGCLNYVIFKVFSNLNHSMLLWFNCSSMELVENSPPRSTILHSGPNGLGTCNSCLQESQRQLSNTINSTGKILPNKKSSSHFFPWEVPMEEVFFWWGEYNNMYLYICSYFLLASTQHPTAWRARLSHTQAALFPCHSVGQNPGQELPPDLQPITKARDEGI